MATSQSSPPRVCANELSRQQRPPLTSRAREASSPVFLAAFLFHVILLSGLKSSGQDIAVCSRCGREEEREAWKAFRFKVRTSPHLRRVGRLPKHRQRSPNDTGRPHKDGLLTLLCNLILFHTPRLTRIMTPAATVASTTSAAAPKENLTLKVSCTQWPAHGRRTLHVSSDTSSSLLFLFSHTLYPPSHPQATHDCKLILVKSDKPQPGPGQALVHVRATG